MFGTKIPNRPERQHMLAVGADKFPDCALWSWPASLSEAPSLVFVHDHGGLFEIRHSVFKEWVLFTFRRITLYPPTPLKGRWPVLMPPTPTPTPLRCSWRWLFGFWENDVPWKCSTCILPNWLIFYIYNIWCQLSPSQSKLTSTYLSERPYFMRVW